MVGQTMLKVLEERNFPVTELLPVASSKSVGKEIIYKGKPYKVISMEDAVNAKPAIAIFSAVVLLQKSGRQNLQKTGLL